MVRRCLSGVRYVTCIVLKRFNRRVHRGNIGDMAAYGAGTGKFTGYTSYLTTCITADGRDGYPVE